MRRAVKHVASPVELRFAESIDGCEPRLPQGDAHAATLCQSAVKALRKHPARLIPDIAKAPDVVAYSGEKKCAGQPINSLAALGALIGLPGAPGLASVCKNQGGHWP
jgi:hypothetical protein